MFVAEVLKSRGRVVLDFRISRHTSESLLLVSLSNDHLAALAAEHELATQAMPAWIDLENQFQRTCLQLDDLAHFVVGMIRIFKINMYRFSVGISLHNEVDAIAAGVLNGVSVTCKSSNSSQSKR